MKLKEGIDFILFLKAVKKCSSDVWFKTEEGDSLNLKSILSQYLFSAITNRKAVLESGRIECEEAKDWGYLEDFLI